MVTLRSLGQSNFVVADAGNLPVVPPDRWIVLMEGNRPVSALAPATRTDPAAPPPAIIVAPADLDLDAALASDAFAEAAGASAVVLVDGEAVVGVWGGRSLADAVLRYRRSASSASQDPPGGADPGAG